MDKGSVDGVSGVAVSGAFSVSAASTIGVTLLVLKMGVLDWGIAMKVVLSRFWSKDQDRRKVNNSRDSIINSQRDRFLLGFSKVSPAESTTRMAVASTKR